ncbi:hypothetical protein OOZ54_13850 [Rhodopseudomonas palustris]|uniref:hypothetical protein n=1 Tax=Rhodopseudomonas palustris TaxID=1076 RepID=UPI0022F0DDD9|nr:hypothetical protein [Rhodopseudomonas palustris]WBU27748.1 hypothetical protein OOZ54_13850 [Rhodopseudomonas palustris]
MLKSASLPLIVSLLLFSGTDIGHCMEDVIAYDFVPKPGEYRAGSRVTYDIPVTKQKKQLLVLGLFVRMNLAEAQSIIQKDLSSIGYISKTSKKQDRCDGKYISGLSTEYINAITLTRTGASDSEEVTLTFNAPYEEAKLLSVNRRIYYDADDTALNYAEWQRAFQSQYGTPTQRCSMGDSPVPSSLLWIDTRDEVDTSATIQYFQSGKVSSVTITSTLRRSELEAASSGIRVLCNATRTLDDKRAIEIEQGIKNRGPRL